MNDQPEIFVLASFLQLSVKHLGFGISLSHICQALSVIFKKPCVFQKKFNLHIPSSFTLNSSECYFAGILSLSRSLVNPPASYPVSVTVSENKQNLNFMILYFQEPVILVLFEIPTCSQPLIMVCHSNLLGTEQK